MPTHLLAGRALVVLLAIAALTPVARAAGGSTLDPVQKTADGYYLDFSPFKVELPRLFVVRHAGRVGVEAFRSSSSAVASGRFAILDAVGDARAPSEADRLAAPAEAQAPYEAVLVPVGGEMVIDLSPTRHLAVGLFAMLLMGLLFIPVAGRYARGIGTASAPRGVVQNLVETLVIYIRDEIAKPNLGDKYRRYLPYLLTAFFFILFCNLLGLVPWSATATANVSVTVVLALFTFFITQFAGTKDYWAHIFWPPGVPTFVKFILIPVEFLGLFTKPFALTIRLFANMAAGNLVILNLLGLIFVIGALFGAVVGYATAVPAVLLTLFVYVLKLLVAFIQAYVFTMLSALFIGMASAEHEHEHDHSMDHPISAHGVAVSESSPIVSNGTHREERARTVGTEAAMA